MRFRVGEKVRLVKVNNELNCYKKFLNKSFTIKSFDKDKFGSYAHLEETSDICPYLENLELFEYTYENLKKTPVGTKVTFENGAVLVKDEKNCFENLFNCRDIANLCNLKDNYSDLGKIIKIEEPTYATVYEYKPEILDDTEKRYLRNLIKPFKDSIETIRRLHSPTKGKDFIQIRYKDDRPTNLPYYDTDTMYIGMQLDKNYTLEELGL